MYIESEFMLLEANNEKLTRENKKLVLTLEWLDSAIEIFNPKDLYFAALREQIALALPPKEECTCLPDLPDGRVNGGRGGCCPVCEDEIYIGGE